MAEVFKKRSTCPSSSDKNFINIKHGGFNTAIAIDSASGYVLPNCVGYAQGRFLEILGKAEVNWKIPACNAEDWFDVAKKNGFQTGTTPKLGAICVWKAGSTNNSADGCGHVAVVEEIKANGDIVTSNSAYGGKEFYLNTITKASGYMYSSDRPFLGFIYCGKEFETPVETSTKTISAGQAVVLNNTKAYASEFAKDSYGTKTGAYFLWDATVKNGRIRITNSASRVGVIGQVTCWVCLADIGLAEGTTTTQTSTSTSTATKKITVGMECHLSKVPVYNSEKGSCVGYRTGTYFTWDATIVNGRIRMTNSASRVGVAGQVSFFVDVKNI